MLNDMKAQNHRLRQKTQRIASEVREYDLLQARLAQTHGIPYQGLPQELLDAFSHDPSSVTGGTRMLSGWKAVEDIHARILRQRDIFQIYLSVAGEVVVSVPDSLLDKPISSLMDTLGGVGREMEALSLKELEVAGALAKVKSLHARVKVMYNKALSHTSVIYPEVKVKLSTTSLCVEHLLAFSHHRARGELQGSIPTSLGVWNGCFDVYPGYRCTVLEELWDDHRRGYQRFPHYTLVPERIHGRREAVQYSVLSSPLLPSLVRAVLPVLVHGGHHLSANPRSHILHVHLQAFLDRQFWVSMAYHAVHLELCRHPMVCRFFRDMHHSSAA
jgi:hypothetical protein